MSCWWALALVALVAPPGAHAAPSPGRGEHYYSYQMSRKSCGSGAAAGRCMWVQECNRLGGEHTGLCVDTFMFGSCCRLPPSPPVSDIHYTESPNGVTRPDSVLSSSSEQSTQHTRPTQRPSFMTKPIDGAPSGYRPPDIPSLGNLASSSESDIVHKVTLTSVNKYQNVNRPMGEETSPHNKISSSPSHIPGPGARPNAVPDQRPDDTVNSVELMSRPSDAHPLSWQSATDPPAFVTRPRPAAPDKLAKPAPTKKFTTTTLKPHKHHLRPKHPTSSPPPTSIAVNNNTDANNNNVECGVASLGRADSRIMGGREAPFGRWPWQVSVRRTSFFGFSSTHRCGGAVLSAKWVATAGHCVDDLLTSQIRIRVGEHDFSSLAERLPHVERGVARKAVHPKYNFFTYEYDLALVQLEAPLAFAPHISPICLPPTDDLLVGADATVTGWGRLSEGGLLPSVLQEVVVPIVSNDRCKSMFLRAGRHEYIPDIFLCAGHERGGHDSCQGDSGGPLQVKGADDRYFLAGIISWGIGCGEANLPGVCTRISKFVPWIRQTIAS